MTLLTWNLCHGRAAGVWAVLQKNLAADLVFLQESDKPDWAGDGVWEPIPHRTRGSAVLVTAGKIRRVRVPGYKGWVTGGEWIGGSHKPLFVFSIHAPSGNKTHPRQSYAREVLKILETLSRIAGGADLVLGGDFNVVCGHRLPGEPVTVTKAELAVLADLTARGLVSCWPAAHPGRPLAQTLRWTGDTTPLKTVPYHCDGIFVPAAWADGVVCEILTSRVFERSDHYPLVAWVSPPG
jgi:exonuclease III